MKYSKKFFTTISITIVLLAILFSNVDAAAPSFWKKSGNVIRLLSDTWTVDLPAGSVDAEDIGITDTGGYFTGTEVETALQELGENLNALKPTKVITISPSGADYTSIQSALDANTSGGELFIVYPGTYTDTINFTANNQGIRGSGNASQQIIQQADATVINFGAYTGVYVERINAKLTAPTVARDLITGTGSLLMQLNLMEVSQSAAITGNQSTILNTSGTVRNYLSTWIYNNTSTASGGDRKEILNLTGSGAFYSSSSEYQFTNTGTCFTSVLTVLDLNTTVLDVTDSNIVGSSDSGIVAGLVEVTTGGSHFTHDNLFNITATSSNNAYGIYSSGTAVFNSSQNHMHVESTSGSAYGFYVGGSANVNSSGDDILAADGNSIAGNFNQVSSLNFEDFTVTGTATLGDGSTLATSAAPTLDAQIANKKYVDDGLIDTQIHGFTDNTETTIGFNDGTYTFTLTDAGAGWSYYRDGLKHTISGNKTTVLAGTPPITDTYFIYIDATDGTLTNSTTVWNLEDSKVFVAAIMWDDTLTPKYVLADERHTSGMSKVLHHFEHDTYGTRLASSGAISGYTIDSDVDANKQFDIAETKIWDEDLKHTLAATTGGSDNYHISYRTGASTWVWKQDAMPFDYTGAGYINYDNAGTMTQGQGNKWYTTYLVATNQDGLAKFVTIHGQSEFSTLTDARDEQFSDIDLTGFPVSEGVATWKFIWKTSAGFTSTGKCELDVDPIPINTNISTSTSSPGLGTMSTQDSDAVAITGGTITGVSELVYKDGLAGGQTINGGTASGDDLILISTANATKGNIFFGTSTYDEVNNRLGVGVTDPDAELEIAGDIHIQQYAGYDIQTISYNGTTTTVDWDAGNKATLTFGAGDIGTLAFTDPTDEGSVQLILIQDGTGSRVVTAWDASIKWAGGTAPTLTTGTGDAVDIVSCLWEGTNYLCTSSLDFS